MFLMTKIVLVLMVFQNYKILNYYFTISDLRWQVEIRNVKFKKITR